MTNDYLAHHGILGQHWGKRNGPPYPLDSGDHSAAEKKAGWRRSLDSTTSAAKKKASAVKSKVAKPAKKSDEASSNKASSESQESKGFQLTENQKTAIKVGVGVAAGVLAAYGMYKLSQNGFEGVAAKGGDIAGSIMGAVERTKQSAADSTTAFKSSMEIAKHKSKLKKVLPKRRETVLAIYDKYRGHPEIKDAVSNWLNRDDSASPLYGSRGNNIEDLESYLARSFPDVVKKLTGG